MVHVAIPSLEALQELTAAIVRSRESASALDLHRRDADPLSRRAPAAHNLQGRRLGRSTPAPEKAPS